MFYTIIIILICSPTEKKYQARSKSVSFNLAHMSSFVTYFQAFIYLQVYLSTPEWPVCVDSENLLVAGSASAV